MSLPAVGSSSTPAIPAKQPKCAVCFETDKKIMRCAKCQFATYCSPECQKKDWSEHKKVCKKNASVADKTLLEKAITARPASQPSTMTADRGLIKNKDVMSLLMQIAKEVNALGPIASHNTDFWTQVANEAKYWRGGNKSVIHPMFEGKMDRDKFWGWHVSKFPPCRVPLMLESLIKDKNFSPVEKTAWDIGCADGTSSFYLLDHDWSVVALDQEPMCIALLMNEANAKNSQFIESKKLVIEYDDAFDYSIKNKVNLVVANNLFQYVDPLKLRELWQKVYESLNVGGCLVGSFACRGPRGIWQALAAESGSWFVDNNLDAIKKLLVESNYEIKKCEFEHGEDGLPISIRFIAQKAK